MNFPYGEWIILFVTLVAWVEKRASRWFFLKMSTIWFLGKCLESITLSSNIWHWHFARIAVMLYVGIYAWKRSQRRVWPLIMTSFVSSVETLFLVNDPGVIPCCSWLFALALVVVAWLTAKSYWGTTLALVGSVFLNQFFGRFVYEGILRHADLPDAFTWNFGIVLLMVWAGLRWGWREYSERGKLMTSVDSLVPTSDNGAYNPENDRELR